MLSINPCTRCTSLCVQTVFIIQFGSGPEPAAVRGDAEFAEFGHEDQDHFGSGDVSRPTQLFGAVDRDRLGPLPRTEGEEEALPICVCRGLQGGGEGNVSPIFDQIPTAFQLSR